MEVSGQLQASAPLPPGDRASSIHLIGGWVDPRAGLVAVEERKITCPCRESNPDRPVRSRSLYRLSYPVVWNCTSADSYTSS
jgi:hypothetical protein